MTTTTIMYCTITLYYASTSLANASLSQPRGLLYDFLQVVFVESYVSVFDDPLSVSASFWFGKKKAFLMRSTWKSSLVTFAITETRPRFATTKRRKQAKTEMKRNSSSSSSPSSCFPTKEPCRLDRCNHFNRRLWKLRAKEEILSVHGRLKKVSLSWGFPSPTKYCTKIQICPTVRFLSDASDQWKSWSLEALSFALSY